MIPAFVLAAVMAAAVWLFFVGYLGMQLNAVAQGLLVLAGGVAGWSLRSSHPIHVAWILLASGTYVAGLLLTSSFDAAGGLGLLDGLLRADVSVGSRQSQLVIDFTVGFLAGIAVDVGHRYLDR